MSGLRDRLVDAGYAAGWGAVKALPEPLARTAFDRAGAWAAGRDGKGTRQLRANLRVVTGLDGRPARRPDHRRRAVLRPVLAGGLPAAHPRGAPAAGRHHGRGTEHLDAARAAGRPVVLALPHSGNWDAAGVWFVDWLGGPFMTVAERLRPEALYERFLAYRESLGFRVVPLTGGERPSSAVLGAWLAAGRSACLLVDRDLSASGIPVTFFGRPTTMPGGPPCWPPGTVRRCCPVVSHFDGAGWRHTVHPEVDVHGTGRLRDRVHAACRAWPTPSRSSIAERPVDWHQLGRIWADVPPDPERGGRS